jgi:hypothetical protein
MARILYLHGSSASPFGGKAEFLERHGHEVVGRLRLPYPRYRRRSWRWLTSYFDQVWFREAVQAAQECHDACRPELLVGSSMGGAVAMNMAARDIPRVLIAPAWRAWFLLRFGDARRVGPATVIVHGDRDRTVFPWYSRRLVANSRPGGAECDRVESLECGLRGRLGGEPDLYSLEGRLVLVRGEGHRCRGDAALRALLAGVEVLAEVAATGGTATP